ncbi:membrane steroid-binding protein 2-like [Magnolia sinica]|uniref:membrane steroid-binding protein 2-like n=1 Tax=Magnolia sinica TaxID=86752 RepID=UPI0026584AC2|nr:membrane steroid-binding protein 2-like [Magnolia sinica]
MPFYSVLFDAITAYTGLSPTAFFTILALMIGAYRIVCGFFVGPDELTTDGKRSVAAVGEVEPWVTPSEPVQVGDVTEEELRAFNGSDPKKPLLMSIKGQIYDVSMSRMFYGPGGPYALFAGRDASRALALMSFDPNDLTGNVEGLSSDELEVLNDWELKFMEKYVKVGQLVKEKGRIEEKTEESVGHKKETDSINDVAVAEVEKI